MSSLTIGLDSTRDHLQEALNTVRREQSPGLVSAIRALLYIQDANRCLGAYSKATRWMRAGEAMAQAVRSLLRENSDNAKAIEHLRQRIADETPIRLKFAMSNTHKDLIDRVARTKRRSAQDTAARKGLKEFQDIGLLVSLPTETLEQADEYRRYWQDQLYALQQGHIDEMQAPTKRVPKP